MSRRFDERLQHILDAILRIEGLSNGRTSTSIETNPIFRAAFERFVEIISEASRHIPDATKAEQPRYPGEELPISETIYAMAMRRSNSKYY